MKGRVLPFVHVGGPLEQLDNLSLLAVCTNGNRSAWAVLFRRFFEDVKSFLSRMLGRGHPDLDDLIQATFIGAVHGSDRFQGRAAVRTWLLGIAANKARMFLRGGRRRHLAMAGFAQVERPSTDTPDRHLEGQQLLARVEHALASLDPDRRAAFLLFEIEGVPGAEAAQALDVTLSTLWRRVSEARTFLRAAIKEGGE